MDKLLIDVYGTISIDSTALIIKYPSTVFYSAQCNGVGCCHPEYEGVLFDFGNMFQDFDDCSYGCNYISNIESDELRIKLANDLDKYFIEECKGLIYNIRFDFDRIDDLKEGWWPIIFTGKYFDTELGTKQGIMHTGNCD